MRALYIRRFFSHVTHRKIQPKMLTLSLLIIWLWLANFRIEYATLFCNSLFVMADKREWIKIILRGIPLKDSFPPITPITLCISARMMSGVWGDWEGRGVGVGVFGMVGGGVWWLKDCSCGGSFWKTFYLAQLNASMLDWGTRGNLLVTTPEMLVERLALFPGIRLAETWHRMSKRLVYQG